MTKRDEFIASNMGLVHSCCHRMTGRGVEYDDLFQAGCVGLIKDADNFDESRGFCFSTYAVPVILGEIKRLFRDGGAVKVGRTLKELSMRALREKERLAKSLMREPTVSELSEELGVSPEDTAMALTAGLPVLSLTYDDDDGQSELQIPAEDNEEQISESLSLRSAMEYLPDRDRKLIALRYFGSKTQTQTAQVLGMTQVQVSRREKAILLELRKRLSG